MIAERGHVDMDEAFSGLRAFARNNNRGLTEVAEGAGRRHDQHRRRRGTGAADRRRHRATQSGRRRR